MSPEAKAKALALKSVREYQSEVAAIREADDPRSVSRTVHVLGALVLSVVVVMFVAKVDRVVSSTSGRMISSEPATVFQSLDPSIIKSLDVKEGEFVKKGQLLATLDPTFAAADVSQLKQQIDSLNAQIARGSAEVEGRPLEFAQSDDPELGKYQAIQRGLFDQQEAQYAAQINSFDQKIAQTEATIAKYAADESRYQQREQIAKQVEDMRSTLAQHGTGSLLNLLASTDSKLEALRTMDLDHNSLIEAQHQLASLKADRDAFKQQFLSTASQELVTARNNLDTARGAFAKASKHQELVRLVAPEDSIVLTIAKLSVGSVLKEGDSLMTLTPTRVPTEAEVQISSRDIGFVRPGDPATIKIDAFNYAEHGTAKGVVRWISDDSFTTDINNAPTAPYYKARITITDSNLTNVPKSFRLIPGMTLTADMKVGRRSVANSLIGEMLNGAGTAMREP